MLLLLAAVLWLTVYGANYPSNLLFSVFDALGVKLRQLLYLINAPDILTSALIDGVYSAPEPFQCQIKPHSDVSHSLLLKAALQYAG